jgi:hypothetical protein
MGIPSPVTKESAGAAYHSQLARQLSDFICRLIHHYGDTIMLIDIYCMFNRVSFERMPSNPRLTTNERRLVEQN